MFVIHTLFEIVLVRKEKSLCEHSRLCTYFHQSNGITRSVERSHIILTEYPWVMFGRAHKWNAVDFRWEETHRTANTEQWRIFDRTLPSLFTARSFTRIYVPRGRTSEELWCINDWPRYDCQWSSGLTSDDNKKKTPVKFQS